MITKIACFGIFLQTVIGELTQPMDIKISSTKRTWNEGYQWCKSNGQTILTIESTHKAKIITGIIDNLKVPGNLSGNYWIGLTDGHPPNGEYVWQNCTSLNSYSNWAFNEPSNKDTNVCVMLDGVNGTWKTELCNQSYHVICESELESCWYDEFKEVRFSEVVGLLGFGGFSLTACHEKCETLFDATGPRECIMYSFSDSDGVCRLLQEDGVHLVGPPATYAAPTYNTLVKRCYNYTISDNNDPMINNKDTIPMAGCIVEVTNTPYLVLSTSAVEVYSSTAVAGVGVADVGSQTTVLTEPLSISTVSPPPVDTSTTIQPTVVTSSTICPCKCFTFYDDAEGTKEAELIAEIKKELTVNTTVLSSFKRKLYSAEDNRSSAVVVGSIGIGFLGSIMLFVAILDFQHLLRGLQQILETYRKSRVIVVYESKE